MTARPPILGLALQARLGSILVHVDEGLSARGHPFDWDAIGSLLADPDVVAWLAELRDLGVLPERR